MELTVRHLDMGKVPSWDFEMLLLHSLRVSDWVREDLLGTVVLAEAEAQERVLAVAHVLRDDGFAVRQEARRWVHWGLTEAGLERHAIALGDLRTAKFVATVAYGYSEFMQINADCLRLFARWQSLPKGDTDGRELAIRELSGLYEHAAEVIRDAATAAEWFQLYRSRLGTSLARLLDGDYRYFTSQEVDSYHAVWYQCHQDFLVTLGRNRPDAEDLE